MWFSWIKQREKTKWLTQGDDDLKFLYARICMRRNYKKTTITLAMSKTDASMFDAIKDSISYFQNIFNAPQNMDFDINCFPLVMLFQLILLILPLLEIKKAVFSEASNSTPGPDGFNFEFFKATWVVIGPTVCNAIKSFHIMPTFLVRQSPQPSILFLNLVIPRLFLIFSPLLFVILLTKSLLKFWQLG